MHSNCNRFMVAEVMEFHTQLDHKNKFILVLTNPTHTREHADIPHNVHPS